MALSDLGGFVFLPVIGAQVGATTVGGVGTETGGGVGTGTGGGDGTETGAIDGSDDGRSVGTRGQNSGGGSRVSICCRQTLFLTEKEAREVLERASRVDVV